METKFFSSLTDTAPGSSAEGYERVVVSAAEPLGEKSVWVEDIRVGVDLFAAVEPDDADDNCCVNR